MTMMMTTTTLPPEGISLVGGSDHDAGVKETKTPLQAMQLEMSANMVQELLESQLSGKPLHLVFGRTPQLRYGTKTHTLQTTLESHRNEIYQPGDAGLEFAGLVSHRLAVQKAQEAAAQVDSALAQLKNNMQAVAEYREANKTIVGDAAARMPTPTHRRVPSKGFKPQHLASHSPALNSPSLSGPSSPLVKPPTSHPAGSHDVLLRALRVPLIHLLAVQPARDSYLAKTCRAPTAIVRELLPKIAKETAEPDKEWKLLDKSFRELDPYQFAYKSNEDREAAIENAIKAFDRLRLAKDDKQWQILLPVEERGKGKCLSRLTVKAPEQMTATPMHKMKLGSIKKRTAVKKTDDKGADKGPKKVKDGSVKVKAVHPIEARLNKPAKPVSTTREAKGTMANAPSSLHSPRENSVTAAVAAPSTTTSTPPPTTTASDRNSSQNSLDRENMAATITQRKVLVKKGTREIVGLAPAGKATPKPAPKPAPKAVTKPTKSSIKQGARGTLPPKTMKPGSTKPQNPSPLSASPPVNASDFAASHPVHKALSGTPSPPKSAINSDRSLKRKANDIDSNIHNHFTTVKSARQNSDRPASSTYTHTPSTARAGTGTPSSTVSLKRKSDESLTSASDSQPHATKVRKVTAPINTALASRYSGTTANSSSDSNGHASVDGNDSSATGTPSPTVLPFKERVNLAQDFKRKYQAYHKLHQQLTADPKPPSDAQRAKLMEMHNMLAKMKAMINASAI